MVESPKGQPQYMRYAATTITVTVAKTPS